MSDNRPHIVGIPTYLSVITALMVLTGVTVWAAFHNFGPLNNIVALAIAVVKTLLVVSIFMHLKYSPKIIWVFAGSGVVFFAIMITFLLGDYNGRQLQFRAQPWEKRPELVTHAVAGHEAAQKP